MPKCSISLVIGKAQRGEKHTEDSLLTYIEDKIKDEKWIPPCTSEHLQPLGLPEPVVGT